MQGGLQSAQINVTASSTLTMDTTLSASRVRLNVPAGVVLTLSGSTVIAATSFDVAGGGEVVFSEALPGGIAVDPSWTGTNTILGVSGITGSNCDFNAYGNASSAVKLTGVSGWVNAQYTYSVPVVLDDGGYGYALKLTDGLSPQSMDYSSGANLNRCTVFSKVSGSGTITDAIAGSAWPVVKIYDASEFAGLVSVSRASIVFCTAAGDATLNGSTLFDLFNSTLGSIYIASDVSVALAPQKDWHGATGFAGSGEVVCEGRLPPANMFTNATWKGTAKISNVASLTNLDLGLYGNSSSSIELTGMGSAEGNQSYFKENATFPGRLVLKDDGDTKALVLNNGYSDGCITVGELAGDGTFAQVNANISQGITINAMTNFTGTLALNKMTVTFGTTTRSRATPDAQSKLFIDQDALISVPAGFELWSPGEIVIDGQVDFTTSETNYRQLVLFANLGDSIMLGENAVFTVNGKEFNPDRYYLQPIGTSLVLKKFPGSRFIFR